MDSGLSPKSSPPPSYRAMRRKDSAHTSQEAGDSQKKLDYENTPLLSRDHHSRHGSAASSLNDDEERPPPTWHGERDFEGIPWYRKPSVFWLLPPFLVYTLAFGGVIVPKLNLIKSLICEEYFSDRSIEDPSFQFMPVIVGSDNPQCEIKEVQVLVSKFILYGNLVAGILSAFTSPKLGALSDRYGRSRLIACTTIGMLMNETITIIVATRPDMFSVGWLILGFALDGLCGSFIAAMAITNAYASDCTEPSKRAVTFGYFHGCLFTGIAVGPIIAGYIVKFTGEIITVFYIAVGAHIFFLSFILFLVPESLSKERQLAARQKSETVGAGESLASTWTDSWRRFSRTGSFSRTTSRGAEDNVGWNWTSMIKSISKGGGLLTPLSILWPSGPGSSRAVRRNLVFLAAVDTTMFGVAMGSMSVVILYSGYKFHWDTFEQSAFLSIVNTCRVAVLLALLPLIVRIFRGSASRFPQRNSGSDNLDLGLIRSAIVFDMIGYIGYATAQTGAMLTASGAIASIGGIGSPTLQSALTKHVPPERTGQLLGAIGLLHALARVIAPTIFNTIYFVTVEKGFPQAVFMCLAATFGIAFVLSLFVRPHVYYDEPDPEPPRQTMGDERMDVEEEEMMG